MDRDRFLAQRQDDWERLDVLVGRQPRTGTEAAQLASLYRSVAADLATAQSFDPDDDVTRYLDQLASRAHNRLYGSGRVGMGRPFHLLARSFPRTLRANWVFFVLANLLFYGPFVLGMISCWIEPSLAERVLPAEQLAQMASMYADGPTDRGGAGADAGMAGFYVFNNIGIALRCFATGALGGLGSLYFLIYNGAVLGTTFGFVFAGPGALNLLTFACGHGAWELTGIVVSGTAGLRMGWALLAPGAVGRRESLRQARKPLFELVMGAVFLLAVAAVLEGFWSASPIPAPVKWGFAVLQVPVIFAWLGFGGRS